jgi:DNA adenine methylase
MNIKIVKPLLKWVGGKTQIIDKIINLFPSEINNYYEPFLGGGSILFALLTYQNNNKITIKNNIYAYDINPELINFYKIIQSSPNELYDEVQKLITELKKCKNDDDKEMSINRNAKTIDEALTSNESYYYYTRYIYNNIIEKKTLESASIFIFLNKLCFRGVFREGPRGFNVPYGHYKKIPEIINKEHLLKVNKLIQNVIFKVKDYKKSLLKPEENDFMYIDPPYAPIKKNSFVNYNKKGFNLEDNNRLFKLVSNLNSNNIKFIMSNSNANIVTEYFDNKKYYVEYIICNRAINSKNPESKAKEVIIRNYNLS